MKKLKKFLNAEWIALSFLISSWLIIIGIIGNYITSFLNLLPFNEIIIFIVLLLILFTVTVIIYAKKKKFKFYALSREDDAEPGKFKALILPVSTSNKELKEIKTVMDKAVSGLNERNKIEMLEEMLSDSNLERWNWAVPLKMIMHNKKPYRGETEGRLKHIRLIGTDNYAAGNNKGSFEQLPELQAIIQTFFDDLKEIKLEKISDFENFKELTELFDEIEEKIETEFNYKDEEIAIDITGGQKLVSIVGAFFTLKSRTPILYLSQLEKDGRIKEINAVINIEPPE